MSSLVGSSVVGHFTPGHAALGGLLLGTATCANLLLNGRVLGMSGMLKGLLTGQTGSGRAALMAGMLVASVPLGIILPASFQALPATSYSVGHPKNVNMLSGTVYRIQDYNNFNSDISRYHSSFSVLAQLSFCSQVAKMLLGGVLVGLGTSLGNGCTSGHGICGLSRLSLRSLAYTLTFMGSGAIAATLAGTAASTGVVVDQAATLLLPSQAFTTLALSLAGMAAVVFSGIGFLGKW